MRAFDLIEIDAGKLVEARHNGAVWNLRFSKGLRVECDAGWRLMDEDGGKKIALGSRDIANSLADEDELENALGAYECKVLHFNFLVDTVALVFYHESGNLEMPLKHLELLSDSARSENWRLIGDDFVDSDERDLIKNLK